MSRRLVATRREMIDLQTKELDGALSCCERILLLTPDDPHELRDRGLLYLQLECYGAARADLERFLQLAPDDEHADTIRQSLIEIRHYTVQIH